MTLKEARMSLLLMGWEQSVDVPIFWERWRLGHHNAYFKLDREPTDRYVGRFAQDGNSIDEVTTYAGMVQMAIDVQEIT